MSLRKPPTGDQPKGTLARFLVLVLLLAVVGVVVGGAVVVVVGGAVVVVVVGGTTCHWAYTVAEPLEGRV